MANPMDITCPKCGSEPGKHCRTLVSNRVTDTHQERWEATRPIHDLRERLVTLFDSEHQADAVLAMVANAVLREFGVTSRSGNWLQRMVKR